MNSKRKTLNAKGAKYLAKDTLLGVLCVCTFAPFAFNLFSHI